jgi:hypothetical protein
MLLRQGSVSRMIDVILRRTFVLVDEEALMVTADPLGEEGHFFLNFGDRLGVHIGLGDPVGHADCGAGDGG